jgi:hypothetical protein
MFWHICQELIHCRRVGLFPESLFCVHSSVCLFLYQYLIIFVVKPL